MPQRAAMHLQALSIAQVLRPTAPSPECSDPDEDRHAERDQYGIGNRGRAPCRGAREALAEGSGETRCPSRSQLVARPGPHPEVRHERAACRVRPMLRRSTRPHCPTRRAAWTRCRAGLDFYVDHGPTGANRERPGLREALAACRAGDTLVVTKLDRLAGRYPMPGPSPTNSRPCRSASAWVDRSTTRPTR